MDNLHFKSWEEAERYLAEQDRAERKRALEQGQANDWQFDTKEEAETVSKTVWYLPDYDVVKYDGQRWQIRSLANLEIPQVRQKAHKWCVVVTLCHFESRLDKTKLSDQNELGIPIVFADDL